MNQTGLRLLVRRRVLVNTDPLRRCYNGCYFSTELRWSEWEVIGRPTSDRVDEQLRFWRELNAYAVSQRGPEAQAEFKIEEGDD